MTSRWVAVLERHLEELVRMNERLQALMADRKQAMIARDADWLERALAEEERLGLAIQEEDRRRQMAVLRLGLDLGQSQAAASRARLAEVGVWLGRPQNVRMLQLGSRLKSVAGQNHQQNQALRLLAQKMMPHFEELLEVLLEGIVGRPAYGAGGQAVRAGNAGMNLVDMQA